MIRTMFRSAATASALFLLATTVPAWADTGTGTGADGGQQASAPDDSIHHRDRDRDRNRHRDDRHRSHDTRDRGPRGEQVVTITDIDVAVATTGGNTISEQTPVDTTPGETTNAGANAGTTAVSAGDAVAVGSQDSTTVEQAVETVLTGDATADITQIVFVFNIGAATANSGANGSADSGTGGSSVSTGDAVAVGQSGSTYVTQAGSADAANQPTDELSQRSVTVRIGVSIADSGGNSAAGGSGSSTVSTGAATAVGNDSSTDVSQTATASASDSASITIEQKAIVINVGIAMANTGLNQVSDLTGSLMDLPEQQVAEQLFAVLLPALLASYADGAGSASGGTVATGDATAIGNQSSTFVDQTATATAAGDGTAVVQQQVVVANVGAAVANTGANQSDASTQGIAPAQQELIVQLAAFLAALLAAANNWQPGDELPSIPGSLSLPSGDLLIGIDGSLTGSLVDVSNGTGSGPTATVRQVVAVVSLGVSSANSGQNETIAVAVGDDGTLMLIPGPSITTGDATAVNSSVIVVCQLSNTPDHPCLEPEAAAVSSGGPVAAVGSAGETAVLPHTGSDPANGIWFGGAVILCGLALWLLSRRQVEELR